MTELVQFLEKAQAGQGTYQDALVLQIVQVEQNMQKEELDVEVMQQLAISLCGWLRGDKSHETRSLVAVLRLSTKLLGKEAAVDSQWLQSGLATALTGLLTRETNTTGDAQVARGTVELLASLGVVEDSDSIINKAGCVASMVVLLDKRRAEADVLEDGLTCLALLAKRTRHRRSLQADSRLQTLLDIVKAQQDVSAVLLAVCRFIQAFSVKEDCCVALLHGGALDLLLAAYGQLRKGVVVDADGGMSLLVAVLNAIWSLSSDATEVQMSLVDAGFLSNIVELLKEKPENGDVVAACFGITRSPCKLSTMRGKIFDMGFLQLAIANMRKWTDHMGVQKEACGVIGNLAVDEEIRKQIGTSGAMEEVVAALSRCKNNDDRKTAKLACGALVNLASCPENREILSKTNVVRVLLYAMQLYLNNENILEYGANMIGHLAAHPKCNEQLYEEGTVSALFLFCHQHPEDVNLLHKSLAGFRHLARHCGGPQDELATLAMLNHIAHAGQTEGFKGLEIMERIMKAHLYETQIIRECALLLAGMSRDKESVPALMTLLLKTSSKALEVHKGDELTAGALVEFLAQLPVEDNQDCLEQPAGGLGAEASWSEVATVGSG